MTALQVTLKGLYVVWESDQEASVEYWQEMEHF